MVRTAVNKRQKEHQKPSKFDQKETKTSTSRKQSLSSLCFFTLYSLSFPAQTSDSLHLPCSPCHSLLSAHGQITALMTVYVSFPCNWSQFLLRLLPLLLFLIIFPNPVIDTCLCTIDSYFLTPFSIPCSCSMFMLSLLLMHFIIFLFPVVAICSCSASTIVSCPCLHVLRIFLLLH